MADQNFSDTGTTGAAASPTPMTDADIAPPPATTNLAAAAPLKDAGVAFDSDAGGRKQGESAAGLDDDAAPRQATADVLRDNAAKFQAQAGDKVRAFAEQGKERAVGAIDQLITMLNDAAATVDDKVGPQYGQYARSAADTVSGFADQIKAQDVDALIAQGRALVARNPAVAAGAAAAVGFVMSRLVSAGVENRDPQA